MLQAERLRVVDKQMVDVLADGTTMGEIVIRGNNVMTGYYKDAKGTSEAFRGGWFHSGDLGVMHPMAMPGFATGRMMSSSPAGEHLHCRGRASPDESPRRARGGGGRRAWHSVGKAAEGLLGSEAVPARHRFEPIEHVRARIARYKALREVVFTGELPKTSTGKVQKFALREAAWSGRLTRVRG
jgi:fatty-acyl-CoA synthase